MKRKKEFWEKCYVKQVVQDIEMVEVRKYFLINQKQKRIYCTNWTTLFRNLIFLYPADQFALLSAT